MVKPSALFLHASLTIPAGYYRVQAGNQRISLWKNYSIDIDGGPPI